MRRPELNSELIESTPKSALMKTPVLLLLVLLVHAVAIGSFMVMSGCSTPQPVVEQPPAPVMPPQLNQKQAMTPVPRPTIRPPAPVTPPAMTPEAMGGQTYTIAKGDSLSKIAVRHGVSYRELADLNGITDPNKIRIGQKLVLPPHAKMPAGAPKAPATQAKPSMTAPQAASGSGGSYTVKPGDTLTKIASSQGTTVSALRQANGLSGDLIKVGQKLVLPGGTATAASAPAAPAPQPVAEPAALSTPVAAAMPVDTAVDDAEPEDEVVSDIDSAPFPYTIKQNDTLESIARNFGVLKEDIMELNGIADESQLTPGKKINIPWQNF
ncbi:MAG: LysM peptidoglycan-binding domain-containing protein [Verrucomicrobia bacterium]|nr:LysM peptidoglycan-binding domain-containing protein [Kiritimatiellia bacterium]MCP5487145.1 LysM peptidoglycan-binding domain-containing protein [Verrucomicrobiota bacterium]